MDDLLSRSESYMSMRLHLDGEKYPRELKIPTFWDEDKEQWIGAIKTPLTFMLLSSCGKDSKELERNFCVVLKSVFEDPMMHDEVFSMFKEVK